MRIYYKHLLICCFKFYIDVDHRDQHSFPTRRSSDLAAAGVLGDAGVGVVDLAGAPPEHHVLQQDRKSTRLNSSHLVISYAVFCLNIITMMTIYDKHGVCVANAESGAIDDGMDKNSKH